MGLLEVIIAVFINVLLWGSLIVSFYFFYIKDSSIDLINKYDIKNPGVYFSVKNMKFLISTISNQYDIERLKNSLKYRKIGYEVLVYGWLIAFGLMILLCYIQSFK